MESGAIKLKQYELLAVPLIPVPICPPSLRRTVRLRSVPADLCTRAIDSSLLWPHGGMALPYTLVLTVAGLLCVEFRLLL